MAYSGLGSGTVGDPYQITTVSQFKEMGSTDYTGKYFLLKNNLDFTGETTFTIGNFYCKFDGASKIISNLPCAGTGFNLYDGASIENIDIYYNSSIYAANNVVFGRTDLLNITLNNIKVVNDIIDQDKQQYLTAATSTFNSNCTINNLTIDGSFARLFSRVYCTATNIRVLNTYRKSCALFELVNSTTVLDKFEYIKPITIGGAGQNVYFVCPNITSGVSITRGRIDFGKVTCSANFGAICNSFTATSGATVKDIAIFGSVSATASDGVFAAFAYYYSATTHNISNIFFLGDIISPNLLNRDRIIGHNTVGITNSYFCKNELVGVAPVDYPGQIGLTTAQFLTSSNFSGWDFATIWSMGSDYPVLRDLPVVNFVNSKLNVSLSFSRVGKTSLNVQFTKNGTGTYGVELFNQQWVVESYTENTLSSNVVVGGYGDELYTLKGYVIDNGVKKYVAKTTYLHYYEDSAIAENNVTASKLSVLNNGTDVGNYIHGTCVVGNFMYGTTRNSTGGTPSVNGCIVKAPINNVNNYTIIPLYLDESNTKSNGMDFLVAIGTKLYTISENYSDGLNRLIVFDTLTDNYQVYKINGSGSYGSPATTDGTFLYIFTGPYKIYKIDPSVFNSASKFNNSTMWNIGSSVHNYTLHYTQFIYPHTMVADDNYLYVGFGTGTSTGAYELQKIDKASMSLISHVAVPKMTDDMCQTNTHLFIGIELYYPTDAASFGYGAGICAIRKSDLRVTYLPKLHITDTISTMSYASLIFGNYLIDLKTNKYIYALDISDPDNWAIDSNIGSKTLKAYKIFETDGVTQLQYPINEIFLTESGAFVGFVWNSPSKIIEVSLGSLNFFTVPAVTSGTETVDGTSSRMTGTITTNGGKTVTECGVKVGTSPDLSDGILFPQGIVSTEINMLLQGMEPGTYYWGAYATNSEGTGYGAIKGFTIENPVTIPTLSTLGHTITGNKVTMTGQVSDYGGEVISACGILLGSEQDLSDGVKYQQLPVGNDIAIEFFDLIPGTYYYSAYATNSAGDGTGGIGSFELQALDSPTLGQSALGVSVSLSWTAPQNTGNALITGYKIERKVEGGVWVVIVENTNSSGVSYIDNVEPGSYLYRISAITAYSTSDPSETLQVVASAGGGGAGRYKIFLGSHELTIQ